MRWIRERRRERTGWFEMSDATRQRRRRMSKRRRNAPGPDAYHTALEKGGKTNGGMGDQCRRMCENEGVYGMRRRWIELS
eukprot:3938888-Rhodomonas_salina.1